MTAVIVIVVVLLFIAALDTADTRHENRGKKPRR